MFKSVRALRNRKLIALIQAHGRALIKMRVGNLGIIPVVVFEGGYSKEPHYLWRYAVNGVIEPKRASLTFDFTNDYTFVQYDYEKDKVESEDSLTTGKGKGKFVHTRMGVIERKLQNDHINRKALVYETPAGEAWYLTPNSNHGQSTDGNNTHFNLYNHAGEGMTVYGHLIDQMQGRWFMNPKYAPLKEAVEHSGIPVVHMGVANMMNEAYRALGFEMKNNPGPTMAEIMLANISKHLNIAQPEYELKYDRVSEDEFIASYLKGRIRLMKVNNPGCPPIVWETDDTDKPDLALLIAIEKEVDEELNQTH